MAQDYYFEYYWSLADDTIPSARTGGGGTERFRYGSEWVTDEMLEYRADHFRDAFLRDAKRIRDAEMERDRKAAEPFWRRWLG